MGRKYDIILFGATGFTGKYAIREVVKFLRTADESQKFTWAVSARSDKKLNETLREVSAIVGEDLSGVDKVVADVNDSDSLQKMAREAHVVLNFVGPYMLWGEQVVKACIAEGTHHLDLSGEPQFLEKMQLDHFKNAEEKGVYVIGTCGFDSIPNDCGATYLEQNFGGDLNSIESYLSINTGGKPTKINFGTWYSAVNSIHHIFQIFKLNKKIFAQPSIKPKYKLSNRLVHYSEEARGWSLPQPFPDERVMKRSQAFFQNDDGKRPVQVKCYYNQWKFLYAILFAFCSIFVGIFAQLKFGLNLLVKYPEAFSGGFITQKGPSEEEMDNTKFTFTLVGKGWDEKLTEPTDQHATPPNKVKILKVSGRNPGYSATTVLMLHSALSILKEKEHMPAKGGVYTPGYAFAKTTIVDRLNKNGVTFTFVKE